MNRYSRQTILKEIGPEGQKKLTEARVAIIGCGGLGSIVAPYLAGAGVGYLSLVDGDKPSISNLHRQIIFHESHKSNKVDHLKDHLTKLNSHITINKHVTFLNKENISAILHDIDLVIECSDNIMCKYLVNDYCAMHKTPMIYGAIFQYDGYVSLFRNETDRGIHLRDIFPEPNTEIPSCSEIGVLGTTAGIIGLLQANEALKFILNIGEPLDQRLLSYNALSNQQMILKLKKTWQKELKKVFESSTYLTNLSCDVNAELDWEEIKNNLSSYNVISLLEDDEHIELTPNTIRMPLSSIKVNELELSAPTLFYCMSGRRSLKLINQLQSPFAFSLKDGIMATNANS